MLALTAGGLLLACSATDTGGPAGPGSGAAPTGSGGTGSTSPQGATGGQPVLITNGGASSGGSTGFPARTELWYSAGEWLVTISLRQDGDVEAFTACPIAGLGDGQNSITMLNDGSLIGVRLVNGASSFYHIPDPPRDGAPVTPTDLGVMPDGIQLEALYTDCDGRVYAMDTGSDVGSGVGNRLLRFLGDVRTGDFRFQVVTDLATASVADIDDMGPGIDAANQLTDNPGFAIDTGSIYDFDYLTGTGTAIGTGGRFGIHALGGALFSDGYSRLYVLDADATLYLFDPVSRALSTPLGQGPATASGDPGHSGLTGPLTNCVTAFPPVT